MGCLVSSCGNSQYMAQICCTHVHVLLLPSLGSWEYTCSKFRQHYNQEYININVLLLQWTGYPDRTLVLARVHIHPWCWYVNYFHAVAYGLKLTNYTVVLVLAAILLQRCLNLQYLLLYCRRHSWVVYVSGPATSKVEQRHKINDL